MKKKSNKLWILFAMGYFSLLLSLSILYHLHHPAWQFCLIWVGWTLQFIPTSYFGTKCFGFFLVLPFLPLADHSCPLPNTNSWEITLAVLLRADVLWCSLGLFSPHFIFPLGSAALPAAAVAFPALQGLASLIWALPRCFGFLAGGSTSVLHVSFGCCSCSVGVGIGQPWIWWLYWL